MTTNEQKRQGDVMVIKIDKLPKGLKRKKDNILVHSDSTQHDHTLKSGSVYVDKSGKMYIDASKKTQIVHTSDHKPIDLEKGLYEVRRQVEHLMGDMVEVVQD